jgi:hypothetical protein
MPRLGDSVDLLVIPCTKLLENPEHCKTLMVDRVDCEEEKNLFCSTSDDISQARGLCAFLGIKRLVWRL